MINIDPVLGVRIPSTLLRSSLLLLVSVSAVLPPKPGKAAMIINVYESGTDTVFSYSGNINLLAVQGSLGISASHQRITPAFDNCGSSGSCSAFLSWGSANEFLNSSVTYTPSSPSVAFGTSTKDTRNFTSTGQAFGFTRTRLYLPNGYKSLDSIVGAATAAGSLDSFGIRQGSTTTYTITNGSVSDTITVSASPVPAPLPILGLPAVLFYSRKLKKRIKASREISSASLV